MALNTSCACGQAMTGFDPCTKESKRFSSLIFVKKYANDGTKNFIDPATVTPQIIQDNVNHADLSKRWYVINTLEEVDFLASEPVIETSSSGANYVVDKKSFFTMSCEKWDTPTAHIGALSDSFCAGFSVYYVGDERLLIGNDLDGKLYPRSIAKGSLLFNVLSTKKGDANNKMGIQFTEARTESASTFAQIELTEEGAEELVEVMNVPFTEISNSLTSITVSAIMPYSSMNDPKYYTEALVADWDLTIEGISETIDTVTVTDNAGVCEITISWSLAATASDAYVLVFTHPGKYSAPITGTLTA